MFSFQAKASALAIGLVLSVGLGGAVATAAGSAPASDRFMQEARQIWVVAAPYYGRGSDSPMPSTRVVARTKTSRPRTVRLADGTSEALFTTKNAQGLVNGANAPQQWLIHEWAHVFQKSTLSAWEGEGGAQLFARRVAPRVYEELGVPFEQPWSRASDGYLRQMNRVLATHGWTWVMQGQWWS